MVPDVLSRMEDNAPGRASPELEDPCFPYTSEKGTVLNSMSLILDAKTREPLSEISKWQREDPQISPILDYKQAETLPENQKEARRIILKSLDYEVVDGVLYMTKLAKSRRPREVLPPLKLVVPQKMEEKLCYHSITKDSQVDISPRNECTKIFVISIMCQTFSKSVIVLEGHASIVKRQS